MSTPNPSPARLRLTASLAAAALTCVPAPLLAGQPAAETGHSVAAPADDAAVAFAAHPVDVKTAGGVLTVRLVDGSGTPIAHTPVAIHADGQTEPSAKAVTAEDGTFRLAGVKPGVAAVTTARGSQTVRVWGETAPPASKDELVLVAVDPAVRGNFGLFCDPALNLSMGIGVAGVVLGAVALDRINDVDDSVSDLRRDNDDIRDQLDRIEGFVSP